MHVLLRVNVLKEALMPDGLHVGPLNTLGTPVSYRLFAEPPGFRKRVGEEFRHGHVSWRSHKDTRPLALPVDRK